VSGLTLPQRLALVRWLTDTLTELRKSSLLPEAAAEMPPGSRMPIMFGGRHAGFASMPKPSTSASVTDQAKLLAWTRANYPDKVRETTEVIVTDDLIDFLADHYPEALKAGEQVDQHWVSDICGALKDPGHYITNTGEKLTEVPGITVSQSEPSPRVNLSPDAGAIIAAAWRGGDIPVAEFLALPAGGEEE
jgi:hypothetical protein